MGENHSVVAGIKKKIDLLIGANGKLSIENSRLLSDIDRLLNQRSESLKHIADLKEEIKEIRLAFDMTETGSKQRAKRRISSIVREIEQCIDLISKE